MAGYPAITSFKYRALSVATTTTSGTPTAAVTIPFRAKYLYSIANFTALGSATASWGINLLVNGSTATADGFVTNPFILSTTTSTAPVAGGFTSVFNNVATLFLNQGDVLGTIGSSAAPYSIVHIVQEF